MNKMPDALKIFLAIFNPDENLGISVTEFANSGLTFLSEGELGKQYSILAADEEFIDFCWSLGVGTSDEKQTMVYRAAVEVMCGITPNFKKKSIGIKTDRRKLQGENQ